MAALIIAVFALLFTVGSFWWLHARYGRLRCSEPHTFAAAVSISRTLIRLPLVLENTGPRPLVVQDLQLSFPDEVDIVLPLPWRSTRRTLKPEPDDFEDLPAVLAVPGFSATRIYVEFGAPLTATLIIGREFSARVDVKLSNKKSWQSLVTFPLLAQGIAYPESYTAYSNRVAGIPDDAYEKARQAVERLLEALKKRS